jgi:hypothetical protein
VGNHYRPWGKVAALIDKGKHLTDEGLAEILLIKDRMNTLWPEVVAP